MFGAVVRPVRLRRPRPAVRDRRPGARCLHADPRLRLRRAGRRQPDPRAGVVARGVRDDRQRWSGSTPTCCACWRSSAPTDQRDPAPAARRPQAGGPSSFPAGLPGGLGAPRPWCLGRLASRGRLAARCRSSTQRPRTPRRRPPTSVPSSSVPGSSTAWIAASAIGSTPSPRQASGSASSSAIRPSAASVEGSSTRDERAVAGGRGVELVGPEQQRRRGGELRPEDRAEGDRPAAGLDHGDGLGGGQPARPGAGDLLERRRDRLDGAEVGAGADQRPRRRRRCSRRTASARWPHRRRRPHLVGDVVGADQDHRDVGLDRQRPVDLAGEVGGLGADHGERAQVDPPVGPLGDAAGQQRAGRLLDPLDAVARPRRSRRAARP